MKLHYPLLIGVIVMLLHFSPSKQDISGSVTFDNDVTMVQASGSRYRFNIQGQNEFQQNGKVLIVFPSANFEFPTSQFSSGSMTCINLDDSNKVLDCYLYPTARLLILKINSTTFTQKKTFRFTVSGITNPKYAVETDSITLQNYYTDSLGQQQYEPSSDKFKITPTAGSLSQVSLTALDDTSVGAFTSVSLAFTNQHDFPSGGKLILTMPKWNQFSSTPSSSLTSFTTNPGCSLLTGFAANGVTITCTLTAGVSSDTIEMTITGAILNAGTPASVKILNFRNPPTQTAVTGFKLITTYTSTLQLIDTSSTFTFQAAKPATLTSSALKISSSSSFKINSLTSVTLEFTNSNPLDVNSQLTFTIPSDFTSSLATALVSVSFRGGTYSASSFTLSGSNKVLVKNVNTGYVEAGTIGYVTFTQLTVPGSTLETGTFLFSISDSSGSVIEYMTSGSATFKPTSGAITSASVTMGQTMINQQGVRYTFTFTPQDSFSHSNALVVITCPTQVKISTTSAKISSVSSTVTNLVSSSKAKISSISSDGSEFVISSLFQADYTGASGSVTIVIEGFTNPRTVVKTDSFSILIGYAADGTNTIDEVSSGLTVKATANSNLAAQVQFSTQETGQFNQLMLTLTTPGTKYYVTKGSYIKIGMPIDFEILDATTAAGTCLKISGFSDEITCSLSLYTGLAYSKAKHNLTVSNGFNSYDFQGGSMSFNISALRNPKTTEETGYFTFEIYDQNGNLQYYYNYNDMTFQMKPAPFYYSLVSTPSSQNGAIVNYTVSLTLSIDTDVNSIISITSPSQITMEAGFSCRGLQSLASTKLKCQNINNKSANIQVWTDTQRQSYIQNGTTISFELGPFKNPMSLQESDSFDISTFITSSSNTQYYYVNREKTSLTIQNTIKGSLNNLQISQIGAELNGNTSLSIKFTQDTLIPSSQGVNLLITLPSNLILGSTKFTASINGVNISSPSFSNSTKVLSLSIATPPQNKSYDILIQGYLKNPSTGPYQLTGLLIDIQTKSGYSIDGLATTIAAPQINCTSNCATCSQVLSNCTSCSFNSQLNQSFFMQPKLAQCSATCPSGYYGDGSDFKCKVCSYPCQECKIGPQLCTKCFANYSMPYANEQTLQCYSECPSGTYLDIDVRLCLPCKSPCFTCYNQNECLSCAKDTSDNQFYKYYVTEKKCYKQCPEGTLTTQSNQCVQCQSPCKTCSQQTDQCSSCKDGYFLLRNSLCVETCPKDYKTKTDSMTCELAGERVFPFPFSILAGLITLGLIIAELLKNQTQFIVSLLAFVDLVLKLNWVFLLPYLVTTNGSYIISSLIIAGCLFMNLITNFIIWRISFKNNQIWNDPVFSNYTRKFPFVSRFFYYLSITISFQMFRLVYSNLLGKKSFSAQFRFWHNLKRILNQMTIMGIMFQSLPALAANIYNLHYVNQGEQLYYFDIDGIILVSGQLILSIVVIFKLERTKDMGLEASMRDLVQQQNIAAVNESEVNATAIDQPVNATIMDNQNQYANLNPRTFQDIDETNNGPLDQASKSGVTDQNHQTILQAVSHRLKRMSTNQSKGKNLQNQSRNGDLSNLGGTLNSIVTKDELIQKNMAATSKTQAGRRMSNKIVTVYGASGIDPTTVQGVRYQANIDANGLPILLDGSDSGFERDESQEKIFVEAMKNFQTHSSKQATIRRMSLLQTLSQNTGVQIEKVQPPASINSAEQAIHFVKQDNEILQELVVDKNDQTQNTGNTRKTNSQKALTGQDLYRLQVFLMHLLQRQNDLEGKLNHELYKKQYLLQHLGGLRSENESLLNEEDRLRGEIEDIKRRLEEFNRITTLELKESESVRREQIRSRGKQSSQGGARLVDSISLQAKEQLNQESDEADQIRNYKKILTYQVPTISSIEKKESTMNSQLDKKQTTMTDQGFGNKPQSQGTFNKPPPKRIPTREKSLGKGKSSPSPSAERKKRSDSPKKSQSPSRGRNKSPKKDSPKKGKSKSPKKSRSPSPKKKKDRKKSKSPKSKKRRGYLKEGTVIDKDAPKFIDKKTQKQVAAQLKRSLRQDSKESREDSLEKELEWVDEPAQKAQKRPNTQSTIVQEGKKVARGRSKQEPQGKWVSEWDEGSNANQLPSLQNQNQVRAQSQGRW